MHTHHRAREIENVQATGRAVHAAETATAKARDDAAARSPRSDAGVRFEAMQLRIARTREREAKDAHARGERRRARLRRLLPHVQPARPPPTPPPTASFTVPPRAPLDVDTATRAYVGALGPHDASEDIHPYRLDEAGEDLADALGHDELARRAAYRDARDAA